MLLRSRDGKNWRTGKDGVILTVADSGCGMSAEVLARVFEPFYTTNGLLGTGLGLWVSKELVDRHGGHFKVRSSQRGNCHGRVVQLFLPGDGA